MNANRGMYAEELVNRTNSYYYERSIALIEKRYLPIKIVKNLNDNLIIGKLLAKSYVDYCGVYQSKHLEFEVKQTNEKNFDLHLIKPHQIKHLINAFNQKAISFLIIYFNQYDEFYFMPINVLLEWKKNNKTYIVPYEFIKNNCKLIEIVYPGVIDYLKFV